MASGTNKSRAFLVLLFLYYIAVASSKLHSEKVGGDDDDCVYTIFVQTRYLIKSGTDSKISLAVAGSDGIGVEIADLERWGGIMGEGHDYFAWGNLDIFTGRGRCLSSPPCSMNLKSDGTGLLPGWYCSYVEVSVTGSHRGCFQRFFNVEQWLATDAPP